jgi:hypothetical protein
MAADPTEESGSISPAGRFARMEAALERIEHKLDLKADQAAVDALEARVLVIENVGTLKLTDHIADYKRFKEHVSDLETGRVVSAQTAEAMKVFEQHSVDIADLKRDALIKETQIATAKESADAVSKAQFAQMKTYVTAISIVSGVAVFISSGVTVLSLLHVIK